MASYRCHFSLPVPLPTSEYTILALAGVFWWHSRCIDFIPFRAHDCSRLGDDLNPSFGPDSLAPCPQVGSRVTSAFDSSALDQMLQRNPEVIACSTHFRHSQTLACSLLLKLCVFLGFPRVFPFRASTTGPCCTMPSPLVPWTCVLPGMDYSVTLFYDLKLRATCRHSTSVVPCSHCAACSYAMTSVPFWTYFWATWLGLAPGTFAYVYLGSAVRSKACLCTPQHPCAHLSMRRWVHGTGLSSAIFSANMSQCSICAQCSMKPPCTEHTFHLTQQLAQCVACPPGRPAPHRGPPCEGLRGVLAGAEPGRCGVRAAFGRPRVLHGACIGGLRHVRSGHLFNARGTEPCPQASWRAGLWCQGVCGAG